MNFGLDMSGETSSTAGGGARVGDNSYSVDNSSRIDMSGANVDTSTKISVGLQGDDVAALGGMFENAIGAVSAVATQSAKVANNIANKENAAVSFIKENATYLISGAIALIVLFNFNKIKRAIR